MAPPPRIWEKACFEMWIEERVVVNPTLFMTSADAFRDHYEWALVNHNRPVNRMRVGHLMTWWSKEEKIDLQPSRTTRHRYWSGIGLRSQGATAVRNHGMTVFYDDAERLAIERSATAAKMKPTEWLRHCSLAAAGMPGKREPPPTLTESTAVKKVRLVPGRQLEERADNEKMRHQREENEARRQVLGLSEEEFFELLASESKARRKRLDGRGYEQIGPAVVDVESDDLSAALMADLDKVVPGDGEPPDESDESDDAADAI